MWFRIIDYMVLKIAIIGWWAAGMMTAATLIESGFSWEIHLFEKNKSLGAKVIISWGGRCNVTTAYYRRKDLESKYIRGSDFVREAIGQFWPRKIFQWFENHGVPLKIEQDMRVFPISDNGKDIVWVFEKIFARGSLRLHFGSPIDDIHYEDKKFILSTSGQKMMFDKLVIATWWNAYTHTWSTWDAYVWLRNLWHTITPLGPSLNSFLSSNQWMHELLGISFPEARLSVVLSDWTAKEAIWPVLFTHFWISGPATFIVSAYSSFEQIDKTHPLEISFTPFADKSKDWWNSFLLEQAKVNPRKQIATILHMYVQSRMIELLNTHVFWWKLNDAIWLCSKDLRLQIAHFLWWGWNIQVIGRRAWDEFVTAGWVNLSEINKKTMESYIIPWLYLVGEILDVDGVTGWYNLTSSRGTGRLAGKGIGEF